MSSGGAGSSGPGADDTTRPDDATFANAVGEGRHLRIAEHSVPTASALAVSAGEARPGEKADAGVKAVARLAGGARPLGIATHSAMMKPELAETSGEAGPFRSRVNGTSSAAGAADAMLAGEARPHGISKQNATTKPENAESSGKAGSLWSRVCGTTETSRGTSSRKFRCWSSTSRVCEAQRHDRVRCRSAQDLVSGEGRQKIPLRSAHAGTSVRS